MGVRQFFALSLYSKSPVASPASIKSQTHSNGLKILMPNPIYWVLNLLADGFTRAGYRQPLVLRGVQKTDAQHFPKTVGRPGFERL